MSCPNLTDQFSVDNNKAKLIYPVGLSIKDELLYFPNNSLNWWTMTPEQIKYLDVYVKTSSINSSNSDIYYNHGVRPVISLKSDNVITNGTGSEADPWVVK